MNGSHQGEVTILAKSSQPRLSINEIKRLTEDPSDRGHPSRLVLVEGPP